MGTNFYARRIPSVKDKEELIKMIVEDKCKSALDKAIEMYAKDKEHSCERYGSYIHLGKRSAGWKFLWNTNHWKVCDGKMVDGKFVPEYKIKKYYELNRESIREYLSQPNIVIVSDYYNDYAEPKSKDPEDTEKWTVDEFMDMALNWCPDGYDSKSYREEEIKNGHFYRHYRTERDEMFESLGYEIGDNYDFYSDGLRFSIHDEFS